MIPSAQRLLFDARAAGEEDPKLTFLIAKEADTVSFQLRSMMSLPQVPPRAHEHPLVEIFPDGEWICDGCSSHFLMEKRFGCAAGCDFDYCEACQRNVGRESVLPAALAIVDMDANIFYKFPDDEVTGTTVEDFVQEYEALQQ